MVYCQHCGTQNDDASEYCTQCGAALQGGEPAKIIRKIGEHKDDECFGLPYGDAICGVIFGGLIIIVGLAWVLGLDFSTLWETTIGPYLVILFGSLIVLGAIYSSTRKKRRYQ